jgi:murein DD-endopeptidase MepM/ murein hydrolase activator NlpD
VVTKENELIKSTLNGVVVMSSWTSETGHVIAIQHENNLLSVYKHNSVLLMDQGERVEAGEAIAIIGNSGKWSSGPHLHFELWYNNNPVDPEQYILF